MVARKLFLVDCETTSLTPSHADGTGMIWELALIDRSGGTEFLWRMEPNLARADPGALRVGQYYARTAKMKHRDTLAHDLSGSGGQRGGAWSSPLAVSLILARLLDDATLMAANPAFDAGFMADLMRTNGQAPTWHYRLRDFGSMAWGYLQGHPEGEILDMDASTDDFARALGVDPEKYQRHSALGDCRLLDACLDVMEAE